MKSKTKIEKQTKKKTNPELVETLRLLKKHKAWLGVAAILSTTRKNHVAVNLDNITQDCVVAGKVLSQGYAPKTKVVAFAFSERAKEKILNAGGKVMYIKDEIKSNPEMKGLKILTK